MPASSDPQSSNHQDVLDALDRALRSGAWETIKGDLVASASVSAKPILRSLSYESVVVQGDECPCVVVGANSEFNVERAQAHSDKLRKALDYALAAALRNRSLAVRFVLAKAEGDSGAESATPADYAALVPSPSQAPTANALDGIEERVQRQLRLKERKKKEEEERLADLPKVLNFPRSMMFPLRVLREPKDKDGNPLPLQNSWIGHNGLVNYIIQGGVRPDGSPIGIPGHSFPLAMTMGIVTECKFPIDPCTKPVDENGSRYIGLGNVRDASGPRGSYLPELARRLGYRGNMRGEAHEWIDKDGRTKPSAPLLFIRRLEQYVWGEYRTIVSETVDSSKALFRLLREEIETARKEGRPAVIPPVGELSKRDSSLRITTDFKIWDKADLGYDNDPSFRAYLRLTPEFLTNVVNHAVPVPTPLVMRLIRNAQDLALLPIVAGLVDRGEYQEVYVRGLQYQIGLNGLREHMRPDGTLASMRRIAAAWNEFAMEIDHPECQLVYDPIPAHGATGEKLGFHPCENLANAWYREIGYNQ